MINMFCLNYYVTILTLIFTFPSFAPPPIPIDIVGTIIALLCLVILVNLIYLVTNALFWRYGLAPLYENQYLCHPHMKEEDTRYKIKYL